MSFNASTTSQDHASPLSHSRIQQQHRRQRRLSIPLHNLLTLVLWTVVLVLHESVVISVSAGAAASSKSMTYATSSAAPDSLSSVVGRSSATSEGGVTYEQGQQQQQYQAPPPQQQQQQNVVLQLFGYVKTSVVRTVNGCGQMWTNHGRCNDIRKKMKVHRDAVKQSWLDNDEPVSTPERRELLQTIGTQGAGAISFEEYVFLQKGKEDRSKLFSLCFLMFGAPKFLPYALMLNPDMLPSPFQATSSTNSGGGDSQAAALDATTGETIWMKQSRERSRAVVECLLNIEQQAKVVPALAKFNIFGKQKQERKKQALTTLSMQMAQCFNRPSTSKLEGAKSVLAKLEPWLYQSEEWTRGQERLVHVPAVIVKGICNIIGGPVGAGGLLSGLQPHFMTRGRLIRHLKSVEDADDFLVQSETDLTTLSKRLLLEACSARLCMGPNASKEELRQNLEDWLTLTVRQPAERLLQGQMQPQYAMRESSSTTDEEGKESEIVQDPAEPTDLYYNGNLARMALMGYYSCLYTRDARSASCLPRLLFSGAGAAPSPLSSPSSEGSRAGRRFSLK